MPDAQVTPEAINSALDSVTRVNEQLIAGGKVPLAREAIQMGAQWSPEPAGEESFDHAGIVMVRGWGDCDDWAPYHCAGLRVTGEDPGAQAKVVRTGPNMWHAVVQRSDGSVDDPSAWAGMPTPHPARAPITRPINGGRVGVAAVHRIGAWYARADLPWYGTPWAISGTGAGCSAEEAVESAIVGVCGVGTLARIAHPDHVNALFQGMSRRGWGS
jgi:hypothetical protein